MEREKREQPKGKSIPQFKRILVTVDGSENSEEASRVAVDLAERCKSELVVLHVVRRVSHAFVPVRSTVLFREYYSDEEKAAMKWIHKVVSLAKSRGVEAKAVVLVASSVAEKIVRFAERKAFDLIVIGTRGLEGFKKLRLGSVSSGVVAHADCSVLVVRSAAEARRMFTRILVAVDGSENAESAAQAATYLAKTYGSELVVLHVIARPSYTNVPVFTSITPPPPSSHDEYYEYAKKVARGYVDSIVSRAKNQGVNVRWEVREAVPSTVKGITECAETEMADLIVLGTRGLEGFRKLLIGSVSSGVISHAHSPVLVVR